MKKFIPLLIITCFALLVSGCFSNPLRKKTMIEEKPSSSSIVANSEISTSSSEKQPSFDFSQYESHGEFKEGLAWVKVSNYKGESCGYIDQNGNMQIPLHETWQQPGDFRQGKAIIEICENFKYYWIIIDIKSNVLAKFSDSRNNGLIPDYIVYDNGIIEFNNNSDHYFLLTDNIIKNLKFNSPGIGRYDFRGKWSEGLIAFNSLSGNKYSYYIDEKGNIAIDVLKIDKGINCVLKMTDFVNGQATIIFDGQNKKVYQVDIGKNGQFIGEPVETKLEQ
jgi:hypothetical protein